MGATGRVEVETLISEKTVEEEMRKLESESGIQSATESTTDSARSLSEIGFRFKRAKLHVLLKGLRLFRDNNTIDRQASKLTRKRRVAWDESVEPALKHNVAAVSSSEAARKVSFGVPNDDNYVN
jgi:hypothetical protein